jgi:hypothetical protein
MSQVVLMDGQWTMCRFLKPFPNFERVYQGADGSQPIAFPGTLDLFAQQGVQGYDPNLLAGITVPLGSRVTIWIPQTIAGYAVNANYQYQILWRFRNVRDYRAGQAQGQVSSVQTYSSYHLKTSALGQPEFVQNPPSALQSRFFLPGATRTVAFEETEPSGGASSILNLRGELLNPTLDPVWVQPLTPAGNLAVWQQGTYVGSSHANTGGPSWMTFTTDAEGDEMAILAYKKAVGEGPPDPWDFTTATTGDLAFSNTYGNNNGMNAPNPFTSILVTTGTS